MESTPPPFRETTPQSPRDTWWSRNWKWFVPTGCLTLIVFGVVLVLCIFGFVFSVLKTSESYEKALARAKNDPRVRAALGTPLHDGMFPSGQTEVIGSSGTTNLAIPISGPKGKGTLYVIGSKSAGEWNYSKLAVKIDGGEMIDLNKPER